MSGTRFPCCWMMKEYRFRNPEQHFLHELARGGMRRCRRTAPQGPPESETGDPDERRPRVRQNRNPKMRTNGASGFSHLSKRLCRRLQIVPKARCVKNQNILLGGDRRTAAGRSSMGFRFSAAGGIRRCRRTAPQCPE